MSETTDAEIRGLRSILEATLANPDWLRLAIAGCESEEDFERLDSVLGALRAQS